MCHSPKKDYISKFISEPLPIESNLPQNLHDHLSAEVNAETIESIQDTIDWVTWTFMYRRIVKNPNYYEIAGRTGQHINDFLSELVEDTVADLAESGCITVADNEMDLEPANLGRIAAFYYVKHSSIDTFARGLSSSGRAGKQVKMRQLLEALSAATEFENALDSREADEDALRLLALNLPYDIAGEADFGDASVKTNILLQSHFSRKPVPPGLRADQISILEQAVRQTHAMVDVISSSTGEGTSSGNNLRPAILCMELSQMIVQALWTNQSPLLQLPFLTRAMIDALNEKAGVEDIADFMNMEEDVREKLVDLNEEQMAKLAGVCNRYPNLELGLDNDPKELRVCLSADSEKALDLVVSIKRDIDEADFDTREEYLEELKTFAQPVHAQRYPLQKDEHWWIAVGQPSANRLLSIKKITNMQHQPSLTSTLRVQLDSDFLLTETSANQDRRVLDLKIYLICDSYTGCDLEKEVQVAIV